MSLHRAGVPSFLEQLATLGTELRMLGLPQVVARCGPGDQKLCVLLVGELLDHLEEEQAMEYLGLVAGLVTAPEKELRKTCLALLARQYSLRGGEARRLCLGALLSGLRDQEPGVQQVASEALLALLPGESLARSLALLTTLHLPGQEASLLTLLPLALLSSCSRAPAFSSKIFADPLDQCAFTEQRVDTDWRQQYHSALLPRFAETLASQSQSQGVVSHAPPALLRATQRTLEFEPTQGALASSLLAAPSQGSSLVAPSQEGGQPGPGDSQEGGLQATQLGRLRVGKRFYKTDAQPEHQIGFFSKLAVRDKVRERRAEEERKARKVQLLRSYRLGDLPDVQISYSDLVKPMMTLCQTAPEFSERLLPQLLGGVLAVSREREAEVSQALCSLVSRAESGCRPLLSAVLSVALELPSPAGLDTARLLELAPQMGPVAALALERELSSGLKERPPKRARMEEGRDEESQGWVRLSEVHRHLGDWDSVVGIFSRRLATHPDTCRALEMEASGKLREAQDVYRGLLDGDREGRLEEEVALWTRGYWESFQQLGQWERLHSELVVRVGEDLEGVWGDQGLIRPLLASHTHLLLDQPECPNNIFTFLSRNLKVKEKKRVLVDKSPVEIAALLASKSRSGEALSVLGKALSMQRLECFRAGKVEVGRLLELQGAQELECLLQEASNSSSQEAWGCAPLPLDPLAPWDTILSLRRLRLQAQPQQSALLARDYLSLCESALQQRNYSMVLRCLKISQSLVKEEPGLQERHELLYSRAWVLRTSTLPSPDPCDRFSKLFRHHLKHKAGPGGSALSVETSLAVFSCLLALVEQEPGLSGEGVEATLRKEEDRVALRILQEPGGLVAGLQKEVWGTLGAQLGLARGEEGEGKSHLAMASLAFRLWQRGEEQWAEEAVRHQLEAVRRGNLAARQLFPRLLGLLEKAPGARAEFTRSSTEVAPWLLLPWTAQLVSSLHCQATSPLTLPLVEALARRHPAAVRNPFHTSYSGKVAAWAEKARSRLAPLLVPSPLEVRMEQGLCLVSVPHIAAKDLMARLPDIKKDHPDTWKKVVEAEYQEFRTNYLAEDIEAGNLHKRFARDFGAKLTTYFSNLKAGTELVQGLTEALAKLQLPRTLKDYSRFLSSYQVGLELSYL